MRPAAFYCLAQVQRTHGTAGASQAPSPAPRPGAAAHTHLAAAVAGVSCEPPPAASSPR